MYSSYCCNNKSHHHHHRRRQIIKETNISSTASSVQPSEEPHIYMRVYALCHVIEKISRRKNFLTTLQSTLLTTFIGIE